MFTSFPPCLVTFWLRLPQFINTLFNWNIGSLNPGLQCDKKCPWAKQCAPTWCVGEEKYFLCTVSANIQYNRKPNVFVDVKPFASKSQVYNSRIKPLNL